MHCRVKHWAMAAVVAMAFVAPSAHAERVLVSKGELQVVIPNESGWCGESVKLDFRAQDAHTFESTATIQKMVGGVRAIMSFECPQAQEIVINGIAGGETVWMGKADNAQNWVLSGLEQQVASGEVIAPPPPQSSATQLMIQVPSAPEAKPVVPASQGSYEVAFMTGGKQINVVGNCEQLKYFSSRLIGSFGGRKPEFGVPTSNWNRADLNAFDQSFRSCMQSLPSDQARRYGIYYDQARVILRDIEPIMLKYNQERDIVANRAAKIAAMPLPTDPDEFIVQWKNSVLMKHDQGLSLGQAVYDDKTLWPDNTEILVEVKKRLLQRFNDQAQNVLAKKYTAGLDKDGSPRPEGGAEDWSWFVREVGLYAHSASECSRASDAVYAGLDRFEKRRVDRIASRLNEVCGEAVGSYILSNQKLLSDYLVRAVENGDVSLIELYSVSLACEKGLSNEQCNAILNAGGDLLIKTAYDKVVAGFDMDEAEIKSTVVLMPRGIVDIADMARQFSDLGIDMTYEAAGMFNDSHTITLQSAWRMRKGKPALVMSLEKRLIKKGTGGEWPVADTDALVGTVFSDGGREYTISELNDVSRFPDKVSVGWLALMEQILYGAGNPTAIGMNTDLRIDPEEIDMQANISAAIGSAGAVPDGDPETKSACKKAIANLGMGDEIHDIKFLAGTRNVITLFELTCALTKSRYGVASYEGPGMFGDTHTLKLFRQAWPDLELNEAHAVLTLEEFEISDGISGLVGTAIRNDEVEFVIGKEGDASHIREWVSLLNCVAEIGGKCLDDGQARTINSEIFFGNF